MGFNGSDSAIGLWTVYSLKAKKSLGSPSPQLAVTHLMSSTSPPGDSRDRHIASRQSRFKHLYDTSCSMNKKRRCGNSYFHTSNPLAPVKMEEMT